MVWHLVSFRTVARACFGLPVWCCWDLGFRVFVGAVSRNSLWKNWIQFGYLVYFLCFFGLPREMCSYWHHKIFFGRMHIYPKSLANHFQSIIHPASLDSCETRTQHRETGDRLRWVYPCNPGASESNMLRLFERSCGLGSTKGSQRFRVWVHSGLGL